MKVVIDTNVVVSAFLSRASAPARLLTLLAQEAFELLLSEQILTEYEQALKYDQVKKIHKLTDEQIVRVIEDLRGIATLIKPIHTLAVVAADPDDNKLFECALEGGAQFIVSGDLGVQAVKQYQGIQVFSPAVFLSMFA